jgi:hypothetical protein
LAVPENINDRLAVQGVALWDEAESNSSTGGEIDTPSAASADEQVEDETEVETSRCTSCMDFISVDSVIAVPCGHSYCQECLQDLFIRSFVGEELFPPRCCKQPIPPESVQAALTPCMEYTYQEKKAEFESTNRTYCSYPECAKFIHPTNIQDGVAECNLCHTRTCTICKNEAHDGDCPDDENSRLLRELATQEGWQTCPSCHRMVELTVGCYHMMLVFLLSSSILVLTLLGACAVFTSAICAKLLPGRLALVLNGMKNAS